MEIRPVSVAMKHLQEEITPPSELVPDIPYSLEQIILKCTQKNGERRYPNTNTADSGSETFTGRSGWRFRT